MQSVRFKTALLAAAVAAALPLTAMAGAASWFEAPYKGITPLKRTSDLLSNNAASMRFDIKPRALVPVAGLTDDSAETAADDTLQVFGSGETHRPGSPVYPLADPADAEAPGRRLSNIAFAWERRFDALNRFALSGGYADSVASRAVSAADLADTHAGFSWTHELTGKWRPSLTGSVFVGDEFAREEAYRYLGRRYLGFAVEGQVTLLKSHSPYLSFQMRRSYYEANGADDLAAGALRIDDRSLVSAGWRWQATQSLSLQAEASYGLNPTGQDLYNPERARVLFGTRFDFR